MTSSTEERTKPTTGAGQGRLAILLEIVLVFLPLYVGMAVGDSIGGKYVSLGGDLVILGGPITYLGLLVTLIVLYIANKMRGVSLSDYGVRQP